MKEIKLHEGEIQIISISKLKPRDKNRNHHPQEQLDRLAEVYKYQGFRNPIIVSNQSGQIVCGTGRFLAAKRAGLKSVPVIFQDYDSPEQEYAHHVADNGLGIWSEIDMSGINEDLGELGPDFDISMLGIKDFKLDLNESNFEPGNEDDQGKLDEKQMTKCPNCGDIFDHAKNKA